MSNNIWGYLLTGGFTLLVCLINNAVTLKKHRDDANANMQKQINNIKEDITDNMADMSAKIEEIIANQETSQMSIKKDIEHFTFCLLELDKKVEKHNNVIERTYNLEKNTEVLQEKMRVANARIADLEHENEKKA